jgi:hypothetical protein
MSGIGYDSGNSAAKSILAPLDEDNLDEQFTLPGTLVATSNPVESEGTTVSAPLEPTRTTLQKPKGIGPLEELGIDTSFSNPGIGFRVMNSRQITARNLDLSVEEESFNKVAWVMEHGESRCASCEEYYVPTSVEHARVAHCNPLGPEYPCPAGAADGKLTEGDVVDGNVVKTMSGDRALEQEEIDRTRILDRTSIPRFDSNGHLVSDASTRLASTQDYVEFFQDTNTVVASDSELYFRGWADFVNGKELDADLAEKVDSYFHGYEDAQKYTEENPRHSAPQRLVDIKPNSNMLPHASKTANEQMEQMILQRLDNLEQTVQTIAQNVCGNEGCDATAHGTFNGQPHCLPGQGCCSNAQPGACPQCGASFHGHDVCGPRGCDGIWQSSDETPQEKIQDHDRWAADTNHGQFEASTRLQFPNDVIEKFFNEG